MVSPGVPTYNDAREAYGLDRVGSFSEITSDETVQGLLSDAYGGDVSQLDAYVGALVEEQTSGSNLFVGPLLQVREGSTPLSSIPQALAADPRRDGAPAFCWRACPPGGHMGRGERSVSRVSSLAPSRAGVGEERGGG